MDYNMTRRKKKMQLQQSAHSKTRNQKFYEKEENENMDVSYSSTHL